MSQPEFSTHAMQSPSLVLVAPMPRRPIALVARRHHHHHSSSQSRSRSSRTISSGSSIKPAASSSNEESNDAVERITSPQQSNGANSGSVRMTGHPYSRAKTPSNATLLPNSTSPSAAAVAAAALGGANGWPLGLGISPVSPPPRAGARSGDGLGSRPLSRLSQRCSSMSITCTQPVTQAASNAPAPNTDDTAVMASAEEEQTAKEKPMQADEPMLASPLASPPLASGVATMDVERTPTKRDSRMRHGFHQSSSHLGVHTSSEDDEQEPRSTPTIGAASPRPQDAGVQSLTLSPKSPSEQRNTATAAAASAQLALSLSSPPSLPAAADEPSLSPRRVDSLLASASVAPSPCLSDSQSRSPTASPSPCPSPAFETLLDTSSFSSSSHPKYVDLPPARNLALPLPPLPTSPIPRKMTRNPFERYLATDRPHARCTLQARLAMAMGTQQNGRQPSSVLYQMESQLEAMDPEVLAAAPGAGGMDLE